MPVAFPSAYAAARTPYLSQKNGHPNEDMNCVPTVLSMMVARFNPAWVARAGGSGDALIAAISGAMRQYDGSVGVSGLASYRTLGLLGNELGLLLQKRPGVDLRELAMAVSSGKNAILVGDAYALAYATPAERSLAWTQDAGHVIAVTGYDAARNAFLVNDPGHPARRPVAMSGNELLAFVGLLNKNLDAGAGGSTIYVERSLWA